MAYGCGYGSGTYQNAESVNKFQVLVDGYCGWPNSGFIQVGSRPDPSSDIDVVLSIGRIKAGGNFCTPTFTGW